MAGDERVEKGDPVYLAFWVMRSARANGLFISRVGWENAYVFENALYPNASGARYALTAYNADEYQNHLDFQGDVARSIPDMTGFTVTASVEGRTEAYTFRSDGRASNEYYRDCWYLKKAVIESSDGALTAEAGDDGLTFSDGERRVSVPMRQYLSCFSMADFPHTIEEAEAVAALWAETKIPGLSRTFYYYGYDYPASGVYVAPASGAARAGNGKASVAISSGFYWYGVMDADEAFHFRFVREADRNLIEYQNDAGSGVSAGSTLLKSAKTT